MGYGKRFSVELASGGINFLFGNNRMFGGYFLLHSCNITTTFALRSLPAFGNAAMKVSRFYIEGIMKTGLDNVVSAIIVNFRAYDTLGEIAILFTAIVGVLAIARRVGYTKEKIDEPN